MAFHLTQGTFSFLPSLTDDEIRLQVQYCLDNDWPINVEFTDDPHPRNTYWEMWGLPMFDVKDPAAILYEINECRRAYPHHYIRVGAYDRSKGRQTIALSFIVNRPPMILALACLDRRHMTGSLAIHYIAMRLINPKVSVSLTDTGRPLGKAF